MKIAKSQLKKVIKEEVEAVLNEGKMKALAAMIGHKATFWVGEVGLTDEDVAADPGAAWLDILTMVTAHWGKLPSRTTQANYKTSIKLKCQAATSI